MKEKGDIHTNLVGLAQIHRAGTIYMRIGTDKIKQGCSIRLDLKCSLPWEAWRGIVWHMGIEADACSLIIGPRERWVVKPESCQATLSSVRWMFHGFCMFIINQ